MAKRQRIPGVNGKECPVQVPLSALEKRWLDARCKKTGVSKAEAIRVAMRDHYLLPTDDEIAQLLGDDARQAKLCLE